MSKSQPLRLQNPFVGRAREQKAYGQLLAQDSPWLLVITGDGGIGKSTLLRHLKDQTPRDIPVALLNFANDKLRIDPLNILEELSWQLAADCQEQRVAAFEQTLADGRAKLSKAIESMNQQFIVGEGGSAQDIQVDLTGYSAAAMREQRRQVRESATRAFYSQLMTYKPAQLALMLDTCEWLSELEGLEVGKWVMDELLPAMRERLAHTRHRLSAVIASRVPPPLTVIERQDRLPLTLPRLDAEAVHLYLQQVGMQDAALRQRVYEITHGHALCVSIIGVLWQEQGDRPLTLADLPQLRTRFTEKALVEYIRERLDERLKTPYRELTRCGVLLRSFDLPMLQAVFPELLSGDDALDIFHQLIDYPYVEPRGNQHYAFHDLLREIQAAEVRAQQPALWKEYHRRALDYLAKQSQRPADWYYHAIACDEARGMSAWWKAVEDPRYTGSTYLASLFEAAFDVTLELSPLEDAKRLNQLGNVQQFRKDMQAALASYEQALGLYQQVGSKLGEANVRKAMGDVQQFRKDMQAALASYEQALGLFRQVGDRLGEANVRKAMGDVQQFREDMQAALASYEQALGLFRQVGSKLGEANVRKAMGDVQQFRKDMQAALASYEQALGLFRQVGDRFGEANVVQAMGDVQQFRKDMQTALASYEQALRLYQQVEDRLGEANVRKAMGDVQQFRKDMQAALASYEQALGLFRQVGSKLGEANCYLGQGRVALQQKDYQNSLDLHNKAYQLYQQIQDQYSQALLLYYRSFVYEAMHERQQAIQDAEQALAISLPMNLPWSDVYRERLEELRKQS